MRHNDSVVARVKQTVYSDLYKNNVCHNALGVTLANKSKGTIIGICLGSNTIPTKYLISWNGPVMIYAGPVKGSAYCWMHDYEIMLDNS